MRKLITSGMFVMGIVSLPVSMSLSQAVQPPPDYRNDPDSKPRNFFSKADCPAAKYSKPSSSRRRLRAGLAPALASRTSSPPCGKSSQQ